MGCEKMNYERKDRSFEKRNEENRKSLRESFNEKRSIGTQPNTTLTSKPNTTKPNTTKPNTPKENIKED